MDSEFSNNYEMFECALSNDKHFVKDPLMLPTCRHYICMNCKSCNKEKVPVKCKICLSSSKADSISDKISTSIQESIRNNIQDLLKIVEKRMSDSIDSLTNIFQENKDQIHSKFEFIKEEIEIKIESIKIELDAIHESLKTELDDLRDQFFSNEDEVNSKIEYSESIINELRKNIQNKSNQNEELLYEYQDELRDLNLLLKKVNETTINLWFDSSSVEIDRKIIGNVSYYIRNLIPGDDIRNRLKHHASSDITLGTDPNDMGVLPNGYLAIVNSTQKNIMLYDYELNVFKKIDKLNNSNFHPLRITTNNKNKVYITDFSSFQVFMTDLNFNFIKSVGSKGTKSDQFNYPNGIAYFNKNIYVNDTENKRIQVLTDDLEFEKEIPLDYEPWIIKISSDQVACVSRFDKGGIYFYDLDTFSLKVKYDDHGFGRLSEINSYFIECCKSNPKLYFYDKDGTLLEIISPDAYSKSLNSTADGVVVYFNQQLLLSSSSDKKILKF